MHYDPYSWTVLFFKKKWDSNVLYVSVESSCKSKKMNKSINSLAIPQLSKLNEYNN